LFRQRAQCEDAIHITEWCNHDLAINYLHGN
jgi:hypothetical protein